jgi:hypothetical protein
MMKLMLDDIYFGQMNNRKLVGGLTKMIFEIWFLKVDKGEFTIGRHSNITLKSG